MRRDPNLLVYFFDPDTSLASRQHPEDENFRAMYYAHKFAPTDVEGGGSTGGGSYLSTLISRVESRHVIDALKNVPRRELDSAAEAFAKFDPDRVGVITLERFVEQWHRMGAQKKKGRYVHPSRRSAHHTSGTTPSYPCYRIFLAPLALLVCSPRGDGRLNPRVAQIVLGGGAARNV